MNEAALPRDIAGAGALRFNTLILFAAVVFSSFNIVPLMLLPLIGALAVFAAALFLRIPAMETRVYAGFRFWFVLFTIYCIAFAAILGMDVLNPKLYRESFRFVVPFAMLVLFSSLYYPDGLERRIKHVCVALSVVNLLILASTMLMPLMGYNAHLWGRPTADTFIYKGLFTSHQGSASFFAVLTTLELGILMGENDRRMKIALAIGAFSSSICLFYATTRAFSLGVLVVTFTLVLSILIRSWRLNSRPEILKTFILVVVSLISMGAILSVEAPEIEEGGGLPMLGVLRKPSVEAPEIEKGGGLRTTNVVARLKLWDIALEDFKRSPIVGTGPSRFGDNPDVLDALSKRKARAYSKILRKDMEKRYLDVPFFGINVSPFTVHSGIRPRSVYIHPHNAYLQVLAEGGVLLFAIFALMYSKLVYRLWQVEERGDAEEKGLVDGVLYALVCVAVASFFTPGLLIVVPMATVFPIAAYLLRPRS